MINKMIRNTILEIAIVILLVIITMFIWPILNKNMNYSLTNALAHESELELILNNVGGYDNVIVNNSYRTNKEYAVLKQISASSKSSQTVRQIANCNQKWKLLKLLFKFRISSKYLADKLNLFFSGSID